MYYNTSLRNMRAKFGCTFHPLSFFFCFVPVTVLLMANFTPHVYLLYLIQFLLLRKKSNKLYSIVLFIYLYLNMFLDHAVPT